MEWRPDLRGKRSTGGNSEMTSDCTVYSFRDLPAYIRQNVEEILRSKRILSNKNTGISLDSLCESLTRCVSDHLNNEVENEIIERSKKVEKLNNEIEELKMKTASAQEGVLMEIERIKTNRKHKVDEKGAYESDIVVSSKANERELAKLRNVLTKKENLQDSFFDLALRLKRETENMKKQSTDTFGMVNSLQKRFKTELEHFDLKYGHGFAQFQQIHMKDVEKMQKMHLKRTQELYQAEIIRSNKIDKMMRVLSEKLGQGQGNTQGLLEKMDERIISEKNAFIVSLQDELSLHIPNVGAKTHGLTDTVNDFVETQCKDYERRLAKKLEKTKKLKEKLKNQVAETLRSIHRINESSYSDITEDLLDIEQINSQFEISKKTLDQKLESILNSKAEFPF